MITIARIVEMHIPQDVVVVFSTDESAVQRQMGKFAREPVQKT